MVLQGIVCQIKGLPGVSTGCLAMSKTQHDTVHSQEIVQRFYTSDLF